MANVPKGMDPTDVISALLDQWKTEVFTGSPVVLYSAVSNRRERFQFFLSLILADIVASNPLIGMRASTCVCGCRICTVRKSQIWPPSYMEGKLNFRTGDKMRDLLLENLPSIATRKGKDRSAAIKSLKHFGLRSEMSPLQELQPELFSHAPYCLLHQVFLGTVKTHLYLQRQAGRETEKEQQEWSASLKRRMDCLTKKGFIHSVRSPDEVTKWTGGEVASFASVALIVLKGLVPTSYLAAWRHHSAFVELVCRPGLKEKHLSKITNNWFCLLVRLHMDFPGAELNGMNWHVGWHWAGSIRQFGVPSQFSTGRYEALHASIKAWAKATNNTNIFYDTGARFNLEHSMQMSMGGYLEIMKDISDSAQGEKKTRPPVLTPCGKTLRSRMDVRELSDEEKSALSQPPLSIHPSLISKARFFRICCLSSGFNLNGGEHSFRIDTGVQKTRSYARANVFAKITFRDSDRAPEFVCFGNPYIMNDRNCHLDKDLELINVRLVEGVERQVAVPVSQIFREEAIVSDFDVPSQMYVNYYWRSTSRFESHSTSAGRRDL